MACAGKCIELPGQLIEKMAIEAWSIHLWKTSPAIRLMEDKMDPYVVVRSIPGEHFTQEITSGKHRLFSDKPESFGGADRGPGPYGYLLAALGS